MGNLGSNPINDMNNMNEEDIAKLLQSMTQFAQNTNQQQTETPHSLEELPPSDIAELDKIVDNIDSSGEATGFMGELKSLDRGTIMDASANVQEIFSTLDADNETKSSMNNILNVVSNELLTGLADIDDNVSDGNMMKMLLGIAFKASQTIQKDPMFCKKKNNNDTSSGSNDESETGSETESPSEPENESPVEPSNEKVEDVTDIQI